MIIPLYSCFMTFFFCWRHKCGGLIVCLSGKVGLVHNEGGNPSRCDVEPLLLRPSFLFLLKCFEILRSVDTTPFDAEHLFSLHFSSCWNIFTPACSAQGQHLLDVGNVRVVWFVHNHFTSLGPLSLPSSCDVVLASTIRTSSNFSAGEELTYNGFNSKWYYQSDWMCFCEL